MSTMHPSRLELSEYHLGLLSDGRTSQIAQHLAGCPFCMMDLMALEDYLESLAPSVASAPQAEAKPGLLAQVKVLFASLVSRQGFALAGGYEDEAPLIYEVGDVQVSIQVQEDFEMPGRKALLGLLTDTMQESLKEGMKAHLWQTGQPNIVSVADVDEFGHFFIENLAPGHYELILDGSESEIHIKDLTI